MSSVLKHDRARLRFGVRTLLIVTALVAACIFAGNQLNQRRLWRDTIFHCDEQALIVFTSGAPVRTNQWLTDGSKLFDRILCVGENWFMIDNGDSSKVGVLVVGDRKYKALVKKYKSGPGFHEYWVSAGERIENEKAE